MTTPIFKLPASTLLDDAARFQVGTTLFPEYRFPFVAHDPTPGGRTLGRMEWCVELVLVPARKEKGRKKIGGIALWAKHTRDPQYVDRVFYLPNYSAAITSSLVSHDYEVPFLHCVWHVGFCEMHGHLILTAYPHDKHTVLVVRTGSFISTEIYFV